MAQARLVQISGAVVDAVYRIAALPAPGAEALVHGLTLSAGGGMNAMVAARRAGMTVAYGGRLGRGPLARMVAQALQEYDITPLSTAKGARDQGMCTVLVDDAGERTFVAVEGADGWVSPVDMMSLPLAPDDWLLLSGYGLYYDGSRGALTGWLNTLQPGVRFVFDPTPIVDRLDPAALAAALRVALWISANRAEAQVMTGSDDPARAATLLAADRPESGGAVVRDGAQGAWLACAGQQSHHIRPFAVRPIDTNGAGDVHIGTFIAALAQGEVPLRAARIANIAAALSTTALGPLAAPDPAAVQAILTLDPPPPQEKTSCDRL